MDGNLIIDNDGNNGVEMVCSDENIASGTHQVSVENFLNYYKKILILRREAPGAYSFVVVPDTAWIKCIS